MGDFCWWAISVKCVHKNYWNYWLDIIVMCDSINCDIAKAFYVEKKKTNLKLITLVWVNKTVLKVSTSQFTPHRQSNADSHQIKAHHFSHSNVDSACVIGENKHQPMATDSDRDNALIWQKLTKCLLPSVGVVWIGLTTNNRDDWSVMF